MISRKPHRKRFIHRLRTWRVEALLAAADELLSAVGCVKFNMDELASTLGVAKGTVYNYAESRESLLAAVLGRWMSDLGLDEPRPPADPLVGLTGVLEVLCQESVRPARVPQAAFPCCLRTSPFPCGWMSRWQTICEAHGLDGADRTGMLGEAVQALAALPSSRALIEKGRLPELRGRLHAALDGYLRAS